MAKLADAPDLGSGAARRVGSTPIIRTKWPQKGHFHFLQTLTYRLLQPPHTLSMHLIHNLISFKKNTYHVY